MRYYLRMLYSVGSGRIAGLAIVFCQPCFTNLRCRRFLTPSGFRGRVRTISFLHGSALLLLGTSAASCRGRGWLPPVAPVECLDRFRCRLPVIVSSMQSRIVFRRLDA